MNWMVELSRVGWMGDLSNSVWGFARIGEGDLPSFGWWRPPEFCRDEGRDVVRRWGFLGSGCACLGSVYGLGVRGAGVGNWDAGF